MMETPQSDYLTVYKTFFEEFAATVSPDDQLPVKVGGYCVCESEIVGEIVDWILQYLYQKRCPFNLVATLTQIVCTEILQAIKKQPQAFGFRRDDNVYQPLKLMQVVTSKVNDVCLRYLKRECLESLSPPSTCPMVSACAVKNSRRRMEDRHTIIEDFHSIFGIEDQGLTNFYAIFDGHAGTDAAVYGVSHLHQFLAESPYYPSNPEQALRDAFQRTDEMFLEKCNRENLRSGSTALCALISHKEQMLHIAWLGDSQALLVRRGVATQLVVPHKPDRQDERERIESMGGCVMYWGTWRVNGQLAVSRAIGDLEYKPYVTATPDIVSVPLDDDLDFLILACDGLWDYVTEQEAVISIFQTIKDHPGDLEAVSQGLVQLSKQQGSVDNISVIVVFLTPPARLLTMDVCPPPPPIGDPAPAPAPAPVPADPKLTATAPSETDLVFLNWPKDRADEDFGPETDVDAVDDGLGFPAVDGDGDADADLHPPPPDVSGGSSLLPESENVADSGEESEDEWNYYRVQPADKPDSTQPDTGPEEEANMESRLNPNAAEFVPSPTALKPSMEEMIAASPRRGDLSMDDVKIPTPLEFQEDVILRPSEIHDSPSTLCEQSESLLPDLLNGKTELNSNRQSPEVLENIPDFRKPIDPLNSVQSSNHLFDESEVSSVKAEFGDETASTTLPNMSGDDYLLNLGDISSSSGVGPDVSLVESQFHTSTSPLEISDECLVKPQSDFTSTMNALEDNLFSGPIDDMHSEDYKTSMPTTNENVSDDISNTFNQDIDQVILSPPQLPELKPELIPCSENIDCKPEMQDTLLSQCALSPTKEVFDIVMNCTEDAATPFLQPVTTPHPEVESMKNGVQSIDLFTDVTPPSLFETKPTSPDIKSSTEVMDNIMFDDQSAVKDVMDVSIDLFSPLPEAAKVQEDLLSSENIVHNECLQKFIEPQLEECKEDNKQQEEMPKLDVPVLSEDPVVRPEVTAAASAVAAGAVAMATGAAAEVKGSPKKPTADKTKLLKKPTTGVKNGKMAPKAATSPTKPPAAAPRPASAVAAPRKPATASPAGRAGAGTRAAGAGAAPSRPTPGTVTSRVTATSLGQVRVKVAAATPAPAKPRVAPARAAATDRKPDAANGETKPPGRRPESLATKKPAAVKPPSRPGVAAAATTAAGSRNPRPAPLPRAAAGGGVGDAAPRPPAKPSVNGVAKPKVNVTSTSARPKPTTAPTKTGIVDKQVKDSANKQISSTGRMPTLPRMASAGRKTVGVAKTTVTTTVTKSNVGKKASATTVTKTSEIITVTPSEVVCVEEFKTTETKDDSPVIDNAEIDVVCSTD